MPFVTRDLKASYHQQTCKTDAGNTQNLLPKIFKFLTDWLRHFFYPLAPVQAIARSSLRLNHIRKVSWPIGTMRPRMPFCEYGSKGEGGEKLQVNQQEILTYNR